MWYMYNSEPFNLAAGQTTSVYSPVKISKTLGIRIHRLHPRSVYSWVISTMRTATFRGYTIEV